MSQPLLFRCAHGEADCERATLPFVAANVAAAAGRSAVVVCTVDAVWLGTQGCADRVAAPGLPPLATVMREFVDHGGAIWLCGASTKPRGITEQQLVRGARIVAAARIVEAVAAGGCPVALT